ncbi:MAG: hypothetical protein OXR72_10665 [Gemmatimonadota bacterium]|nr:hypothetical protein [Gemmatimonadota bacterium]
MPNRNVFQCAPLVAVCILAPLMSGDAVAGIETRELSGRLSVESRWHPKTGAWSGQRSHGSGIVVEPRVYLEDTRGRSFTLAPFLRLDAGDERRTHADLREAYFLVFGEVRGQEWEVRLGVDRVFWGVTESRRLVNIVNQIDLVEHPYKEPSMGQAMAHLTMSGDWGAVEVFGMTGHRARTFPGRSGRLRFPLVVDNERVSYESDAGRWRPEFAARFSRSSGDMDVGVSVFDGNSREPVLSPGIDPNGRPVLLPGYERIRQFGLDAQLTAGPWLFKLEGLGRAGARDRRGVEEDYVAATLGGEYTVYSVFGSAADLSLIGEWNYDGRGRNATNIFQNDLFLAARLAFNDIQSTEVLGSLMDDFDTTTRVLTFELNRRISGRFSLHLEAIALLDVDAGDLSYASRRDSFVEMHLVYNH